MIMILWKTWYSKQNKTIILEKEFIFIYLLKFYLFLKNKRICSIKSLSLNIHNYLK